LAPSAGTYCGTLFRAAAALAAIETIEKDGFARAVPPLSANI